MKMNTIKNVVNKNVFSILLNILPKRKAYELEYWRQNRRIPDLSNPKRYTEKLFWLIRYNELYNRELIQRIYDKHTVRDYVNEKGLGHILIKQVACFNTVNEIDYNSLPESFALKMTQSSGENIICKDKTKINENYVIEKFQNWEKKDKKKDILQGYYFTENEKIVCEELLIDENGEIPLDFRVYCCNGEPKFICCDLESLDENNNKKSQYYRECFDLEWNYLAVDFMHRPRKNKETASTLKPDNLDLVLEYARKLSEDFIFVRVDFYLVNEKIYFGELTPIPGQGGGFTPDEYDFIFGNMIQLPKRKVF